MLTTLYILASAILYRVPRGGPSREKWQQWLGWDGPGSTGGRLIWAPYALSTSKLGGPDDRPTR